MYDIVHTRVLHCTYIYLSVAYITDVGEDITDTGRYPLTIVYIYYLSVYLLNNRGGGGIATSFNVFVYVCVFTGVLRC